MNKWLSLLGLFLLLGNPTRSQSTDNSISQIGPVGSDPSKLCKFYIFRPEDELSLYYFGLVCDDYYGLFAKVYSGNAYEINCGEVGKRTFYFQTVASGKQSVELDLKVDSVYYLKLTAFGTKDNPEISLQKLSPSEGKSLLQSFDGKMNKRYSTIPFQNSFYVSDQFRNESNIPDKMKDSVYRNISKSQHISFINPSQLDAGMVVMGIPTLFYLSRTISLTYSEGISVTVGGKLKVSSKEEFKNYIDKNLIKKKTEAKETRYKNYKYEIISENDHPIGNYNMLVYLSYEDHEAANLEGNKFLAIHDLYRIISYKNSKGKLEWSMLLYSERGVESELRSKEEFVKRYHEVDQSIQLHMIKK